MSEIEKMKKYIERTPISTRQQHIYSITSVDVGIFFDAMQEDWFDAICTVYNYGRAKGYRAAKAEARRA